MKEWVKEHPRLTFVIFWGVFIVIIILTEKPWTPDRSGSERYEAKYQDDCNSSSHPIWQC